MKFFAIAPVTCGGHAYGIPVAFAFHESGYVVRLVCPTCERVWDDLSALNNPMSFEDAFQPGAPADDVAPFDR